ncbi:unnamed protein product [Colias eurytheme]|nr:unnamed protein product [Colias eurytheme]
MSREGRSARIEGAARRGARGAAAGARRRGRGGVGASGAGARRTGGRRRAAPLTPHPSYIALHRTWINFITPWPTKNHSRES